MATDLKSALEVLTKCYQVLVKSKESLIEQGSPRKLQVRVRHLEIKAQAELHLPLRKRRSKTQWLARRERTATVQIEGWGDDAYHIVDTTIVRPVEEVESFHYHLQF